MATGNSRARRDTTIHLLRPGTILLVDDDKEWRTQIKAALEAEGLEVAGLESANHALRYIQIRPWNWYPWLVITDLVMDGMGGYQLMRRITELYPKREIPMLVVSKLGSAEDMAEAELAGASIYLRKPVTPEALIEAIKKVTDKKNKKTLQLTTIEK